MKIFLTFFVLFFSSCAFSDDISLGEIKLLDKITDHFSRKEILDFEYKGSRDQYGVNKKYSLILINDPQNIIGENFDVVVIAYENHSWEVNYVSAFVTAFKDLSSCIEFKKKQIVINNNQIKNLYKKESSMDHTNLNQQELTTGFSDEKKIIKFGCDYFPEREDANYRFAFFSTEFNSWVLESEGTQLQNNL